MIGIKRYHMESRESCSPIVTRAVAAGLKNEHSDTFQFPFYQRVALNVLGMLPQRAARWIIPRTQKAAVPDPDLLDSLCLDDFLALRLKDYDGIVGPFDVLTIGAALGGATTQISLGLGGPFLPQAFVITLKGGSKDGNLNAYIDHCRKHALRFAERHPDVITIQHFDPVHDGWLTKSTNHFRIKLLALPEKYKEFMIKNLRPGGLVTFLDCGAQWLRYQLGERSYLQIGGWGGISPEEYIHGSGRISEYCRLEGLSHDKWGLPDFPVGIGPESEWGCEPELVDSIKKFCSENGFRFVRIYMPNPNDFSRLALHTVAERLRKAKVSPRGMLIEMFTQFDSTAALQAGLLPLWLVFNTSDSVEFLEKMLHEIPCDLPVYFSPLATFSVTPDLATMKDWRKVLADREWINIGARESHYPADARALISWNKPLRKLGDQNNLKIPPVLSVEEVNNLAASI